MVPSVEISTSGPAAAKDSSGRGEAGGDLGAAGDLFRQYLKLWETLY